MADVQATLRDPFVQAFVEVDKVDVVPLRAVRKTSDGQDFGHRPLLLTALVAHFHRQTATLRNGHDGQCLQAVHVHCVRRHPLKMKVSRSLCPHDFQWPKKVLKLSKRNSS